jgi:putative transposase
VYPFGKKESNRRRDTMTYQQSDFTLPAALLAQIAEQGFEALPDLIRIVINEAMRLERQQYLGVAPYQRSPERRGHGNGFKDHTERTRLGEITFAVPQVREGGFFPQALDNERGSGARRTGAAAACWHSVVFRRLPRVLDECWR